MYYIYKLAEGNNGEAELIATRNDVKVAIEDIGEFYARDREFGFGHRFYYMVVR